MLRLLNRFRGELLGGAGARVEPDACDGERRRTVDPEFLRQLVPALIAVTLTDGQTTVQDVRISR